MANPSKQKGTAAETAVVDLAKRLDIPAVRPSLSGANDQGDVWLWPEDDGALVTVEVKNRPTEFSHFPSWPLIQQWWAETEREAVNTPNCDLSVLAVKPIGVAYKRGLHMYHHHRRDPLASNLPAKPPFDLTEAACVGLWELMTPDPAGPGVPPPADVIAAAKAVCLTCPLIDPCRDWAIENREVQGVWGGVWFGSAKERAAARRRRTA